VTIQHDDTVDTKAGLTVVVTGANGFLGRHLVRAARSVGVNVIPAVRPGTTAAHDDSVLQLDVMDAAGWRAALAALRPHAVVHLAAAGVHAGTGLDELAGVNVMGLAVLGQALADEDRGTQLVVAGTCFEYAPAQAPIPETAPLAPLSPYGASKAAATVLARFWGDRMPTTLLRPFQVYGPGERLPRLIPYVIECGRRGVPAELGPGTHLRDFVYVEDVAHAFVRTVAAPPTGQQLRLLNVGTGVGTTLADVVRGLAGLLSERGRAPELRFGSRADKGPESSYVADVSALRRELGWQPQTALLEGLRSTVDHAVAAA